MNITISFEPSVVLVVPNIPERDNTEKFKKNLNKILQNTKDKDIFIFCRDSNRTRLNAGSCETYSYNLSTFQVLEHAKRKNSMELEKRIVIDNNFQIPNAVIIIMVEPTFYQKYIDTYGIDKISLNHINHRFKNDVVDYDLERIMSYMTKEYSRTEPFPEMILNKLKTHTYTISYIDALYDSDTGDHLNDLIEENKGFKISRALPNRWFTRGNRQALKKLVENNEYKRNDKDNFPNYYGGRSRRSNRKGKKSFRRHSPLSY